MLYHSGIRHNRRTVYSTVLYRNHPHYSNRHPDMPLDLDRSNSFLDMRRHPRYRLGWLNNHLMQHNLCHKPHDMYMSDMMRTFHHNIARSGHFPSGHFRLYQGQGMQHNNSFSQLHQRRTSRGRGIPSRNQVHRLQMCPCRHSMNPTGTLCGPYHYTACPPDTLWHFVTSVHTALYLHRMLYLPAIRRYRQSFCCHRSGLYNSPRMSIHHVLARSHW